MLNLLNSSVIATKKFFPNKSITFIAFFSLKLDLIFLFVRLEMMRGILKIIEMGNEWNYEKRNWWKSELLIMIKVKFNLPLESVWKFHCVKSSVFQKNILWKFFFSSCLSHVIVKKWENMDLERNRLSLNTLSLTIFC